MERVIEFYDGLVLGLRNGTLFVCLAWELEADLRSYLTVDQAEVEVRARFALAGDSNFLLAGAVHATMRDRRIPGNVELRIYSHGGRTFLGTRTVGAKSVRREIRRRARLERVERLGGLARNYIEYCREIFLPACRVGSDGEVQLL